MRCCLDLSSIDRILIEFLLKQFSVLLALALTATFQEKIDRSPRETGISCQLSIVFQGLKFFRNDETMQGCSNATAALIYHVVAVVTAWIYPD